MDDGKTRKIFEMVNKNYPNTNKKVLKTLEYDKIIHRLTEQCTSEAGKIRAAALLPQTDRAAACAGSRAITIRRRGSCA